MIGLDKTYDEASLSKFWAENEDRLLLEFLEKESPCVAVKDWDALWTMRFDSYVRHAWREANIR